MKKKWIKVVIIIVAILIIAGVVVLATKVIPQNLNKNENSSQAKQDEQSENNKNVNVESDNIEVPSDDVANELYKKAMDLCWNEGFKLSDESTEVYIEEADFNISAREIININDLLKNVFSTNGKNSFLDYAVGVVEKDGKVYRIDADRGSNILYDSTQLVIKNKEDGKIEYTAKCKYLDDDLSEHNAQYEESSFVIVKENGKWLVDEFVLPN